MKKEEPIEEKSKRKPGPHRGVAWALTAFRTNVRISSLIDNFQFPLDLELKWTIGFYTSIYIYI